MAESVEPVANAAWKGRAADGTYPLPIPDDPDEPVVQVSRRDLASMVLLGVGTVCGVIGATATFGWGGGLMAVWATAIPVALLIGDN